MLFIKPLLLLMFIFSKHVADVLYVKTTEHPKDERTSYDLELLKLALEKTKSEYGEYILKIAPEMNFAQAIRLKMQD